ncbi:MAG TPA: SDR family oxidoreductase [Bryobacteraceae bacterium]|nr:SDR family oxidoreductase [Bryobacteraceae bacterium]
MQAALFSGKTVLVTGASRGLGRHIAEAFWRHDADVFLVARSGESLAALCGQLVGNGRETQRDGHFAVDLAAPDTPARIFDALQRFSGRLDVLVNNAAIVGPIGPLEENDWAQWQKAIQVNLLAPVALCRLAIQRMKSQGGGSIVNISGGGATSPRPCFSAYATAKAGLVRFTETIAAEAAHYGIRINAIAPGAMNTEMHDAVLRAGPTLAGESEYRKALEQAERGGTSPASPAELAVFLASDAAAGINGRLISAVWDPWKNLAAYAAELARSDVYTLRRIVPEDRGFNWQ